MVFRCNLKNLPRQVVDASCLYIKHTVHKKLLSAAMAFSTAVKVGEPANGIRTWA
jgi:hypothetical protein